jgi:hypothetical protein
VKYDVDPKYAVATLNLFVIATFLSVLLALYLSIHLSLLGYIPSQYRDIMIVVFGVTLLYSIVVDGIAAKKKYLHLLVYIFIGLSFLAPIHSLLIGSEFRIIMLAHFIFAVSVSYVLLKITDKNIKNILSLDSGDKNDN